VGAYRADDDVSDLLNCATHIEEQTVEFLCGYHQKPETGNTSEAIGIRIKGCLAGLGTGAYLTLSALGVTRILSRTDVCEVCEWHSLRSEIHHQAERANRFLSGWDKKNAVICMDAIEAPVERVLWNAKNPPISRRDLFRFAAREGQIAMARTMENGTASTERKPGRDRLRLLAAVSHLPEPVANTDLQPFGFATLAISDACIACGACGRACPTQALRFDKNEEEMTFAILFTAKNCIDCGLCDHVCLPDAISFNHVPTFEEVFAAEESPIVESGELVRCERCKSWTAKREGVKYCQLCEYRREHPFGSMMSRKIIKESRS
jgi:ferredoxin